VARPRGWPKNRVSVETVETEVVDARVVLP